MMLMQKGTNLGEYVVMMMTNINAMIMMVTKAYITKMRQNMTSVMMGIF